MAKTREKQRLGDTISNLYYYPAFLMIPKEFLLKVAPDMLAIPRSLGGVIASTKAHELIGSDRFVMVVIHLLSNMVWQVLMPEGSYMETYCMRDPLYALAHCPSFWIQELQEMGHLPSIEEMLMATDRLWEEQSYLSMSYASELFSWDIPYIRGKYNLEDIIRIVEEHRCFEDYAFWDSREKQAFFRDWYHTRTQHPMISLEDYKTEYAVEHQGEQWDPPDESPSFENEVDCQILAEQFMKTLSEKDRQILQLRLEGYTLEEVAARLGYSNHSGVIKRLRKIGQAFEKFADVDYGFDGRRILSTY